MNTAQLEGSLLDDRYRLSGVIGKGGMGVVFEGYDIETRPGGPPEAGLAPLTNSGGTAWRYIGVGLLVLLLLLAMGVLLVAGRDPPSTASSEPPAPEGTVGDAPVPAPADIQAEVAKDRALPSVTIPLPPRQSNTDDGPSETRDSAGGVQQGAAPKPGRASRRPRLRVSLKRPLPRRHRRRPKRPAAGSSHRPGRRGSSSGE